MSTAEQFPADWVVKPFGEVVSTVKGKKPKDNGPPTKKRTVPYINIKAFETGVPEQFASPGNYRECSKEDILMVWDGARSGLVGRGVSGYIGSTLAKLEAEDVSSSYLFYFLQGQYSYINTNTKGVGIPHVDPSVLKAIPFPIAPHDQQDRIVAEIEKQFSRLDEAVASLKRVKANLKRYKAAVLKAAVEGKLTEEWRKQNPDVEPARILLERILAERRAKWEEAELAKVKAKGKEPKDDMWKEGYAEFDLSDIDMPSEISETWGKCAIGQIFDVVVGATPSRREPAYWGGGIPWVSSGEVDFCKITETRETISAEGLGNSSTKLNPVGTVLLGMIGEGKTRGQAAILEIEACNNQNSAAIRVSETEILPIYIYYFLVSQYEETRRRGSGGNQPALNKSRVQRISCPLPPVSEQIEIVFEIERMLSMEGVVLGALETSCKKISSCRQAILARAFDGTLFETSGMNAADFAYSKEKVGFAGA